MHNLEGFLRDKEVLISDALYSFSSSLNNRLISKKKDVFSLYKKLLKLYVYSIKNAKHNYDVIYKLIHNRPNNEENNKYRGFDLNLNDLESMKLLILQIEKKEKTIQDLKGRTNELLSEKEDLVVKLQDKDQAYKQLETEYNQHFSRVEDLQRALNQKNSDIQNLKNKADKLEKDIFELEGIKKIQYETIDNLKAEKKQQFIAISKIKDEFKLIIQEYTDIINELN